jgi:hypothetical protein
MCLAFDNDVIVDWEVRWHRLFGNNFHLASPMGYMGHVYGFD